MNKNLGLVVTILLGQLVSGVGIAEAAPKTEAGFYASVPKGYMDDPRRLEWQKAPKVIEHLLLKKGDVIADIGAGTGFFTMLFAPKVGEQGLVYAVDVDESMVKLVKQRAEKAGFNNVKPLLATPSDPALPKGCADVIFVCDTYLFFEKRQEYLGRLRESLKPEGRLAIIAFNANAEIPGAPPVHKMISREQTVQEAERAGLALEAEYFFLPYQDFLLFTKRK